MSQVVAGPDGAERLRFRVSTKAEDGVGVGVGVDVDCVGCSDPFPTFGVSVRAAVG